MSLAKGLSILFIFQRSRSNFIDSFSCLFSLCFIFCLIFVISFLLIWASFIHLFFFLCFLRFIWDFYCFLSRHLLLWNSLLRTAFELRYWRRLLRVRWTARRSTQSILKDISPGISLEGMTLKLKLQSPHEKSWLIGKDSDAGRDWGQEEKGTTEDEMAGWCHWLDGCESEWTLGVGDGQGGLACCDSWGRKESDTTERLNWTELRTAFASFHKL